MTLPTRPLGRTGHRSSILTLGGAALAPLSQREADDAVEEALAQGVNHFDVAPSYGDAEVLIAPSVDRHRDAMFLACKTTERKRFRAEEELDRSLERLGTDYVDLYQCHSLANEVDLEQILGPRGVVEIMDEARQAGKIRFLGITGHHCGVLEAALKRYPFDTVMFPLNPVQAAGPSPAHDYRSLVATAQELGVAMIAIKSVARRPWPNGARRRFTTWYEPFDDPETLRQRLTFTLSHQVTTAVLPSDIRLWPALYDTAKSLDPMTPAELESMITGAEGESPLYVTSVLPARQAYGPGR